MAEPVLRLEALCKSFGGLRVTDDVTLDVMPGELHAIIGPNGAGKTTLISQLTGQLAPSAGTIHFAGRDVTQLTAWRRRPMTGTPSISGARPARRSICATRRCRH